MMANLAILLFYTPLWGGQLDNGKKLASQELQWAEN